MELRTSLRSEKDSGCVGLQPLLQEGLSNPIDI